MHASRIHARRGVDRRHLGRKAEWRVKRVTHIHCFVDPAHTHFDLSLRRLLVFCIRLHRRVSGQPAGVGMKSGSPSKYGQPKKLGSPSRVGEKPSPGEVLVVAATEGVKFRPAGINPGGVVRDANHPEIVRAVDALRERTMQPKALALAPGSLVAKGGGPRRSSVSTDVEAMADSPPRADADNPGCKALTYYNGLVSSDLKQADLKDPKFLVALGISRLRKVEERRAFEAHILILHILNLRPRHNVIPLWYALLVTCAEAGLCPAPLALPSGGPRPEGFHETASLASLADPAEVKDIWNGIAVVDLPQDSIERWNLTYDKPAKFMLEQGLTHEQCHERLTSMMRKGVHLYANKFLARMAEGIPEADAALMLASREAHLAKKLAAAAPVAAESAPAVSTAAAAAPAVTESATAAVAAPVAAESATAPLASAASAPAVIASTPAASASAASAPAVAVSATAAVAAALPAYWQGMLTDAECEEALPASSAAAASGSSAAAASGSSAAGISKCPAHPEFPKLLRSVTLPELTDDFLAETVGYMGGDPGLISCDQLRENVSKSSDVCYGLLSELYRLGRCKNKPLQVQGSSFPRPPPLPVPSPSDGAAPMLLDSDSPKSQPMPAALSDPSAALDEPLEVTQQLDTGLSPVAEGHESSSSSRIDLTAPALTSAESKEAMDDGGGGGRGAQRGRGRQRLRRRR
jgi:hypothetical protein